MSTSTNNSSAGKSNGFNNGNVQEIEITVPWGQISGKWWGPKDVEPIIALHGWQDNAGSFDELAPLLPANIAVFAIDLPGHGLSSHFPKGQFYYVFWDGVLQLRRIVKYYKWDKVKLLGHSLGGAISFLYAACYPEDVEFIICLDIASPYVRDVTKSVTITGANIDKFLKYETLPEDSAPSYEYDRMVDIVEDAYKGSITRSGAEILMKRGMQPGPVPGRYYFSRDPRLKVSLLGMLSMDQVLAYASQIKCAYLNIRATPGLKLEQPETYEIVLDTIKKGSSKFEYHLVSGTHHVHLTDPEVVAPIIKNFLRTYRDSSKS